MKVLNILILFLIKLYYQYEFDSIIEFIPKSSILHDLGSKNYKIYKYTPFCAEETSKTTKNIAISLISSNLVNLYIYDNFSNIKQINKGKFANYNMTREFTYLRTLSQFNDFICKKDYYFVISINFNERNYVSFPVAFKFSILDGRNVYTMNPSLSNEYILRRISKNELNIFYEYKETKIALISLENRMKFNIMENGKLFYQNNVKDTNSITKLLFKKNHFYVINYQNLEQSSIYYSSAVIQFYNESDYIKYDFIYSPLLLAKNYEYYLELDISKYKQGEDIIIELFNSYSNSFTLKYQYKKTYKNNNFIVAVSVGGYEEISYVRIKKENNDDNLILYLISSKGDFSSFMNILTYKIEKIKSDKTLEVKGQKVFYLDYYDFNKYNSFGIYSNKAFYFIEQSYNKNIKTSKKQINNLIIITKDLDNIYNQRNALIFFDDNISNTTILEFKKFDYPIIEKHLSDSISLWSSSLFNQYFIFDEKSNHKQEYYFYVNDYKDSSDLFLPILGDYESYFIKKSDIKSLSDFDFNKQEKIINLNNTKDIGYLKIASNKHSIFQHFVIHRPMYFGALNLNTGRKYYYDLFYLYKKSHITFDNKYDNKIIPLKFRLYGADSNSIVSLLLNKKKYIINNTGLEINYLFNQNNSQIYFDDINVTEKTYLEVTVGFLDEDLALFKQIDFIESIGELSLEKGKHCIIKIPKDFNEELYDYSIIFPNKDYFDIYINYDKIEFAVGLDNSASKGMYHITNLFKLNPYLNLKNEKDKYFYITIIGSKYNNKNSILMIKKPKLYKYNFQFNKINIIPELTNKNKQYYYKIEIPKGNYNYTIVQTYSENYSNFISKNDFFYKELNMDLNIYNQEILYNNLDSESLYLIVYKMNNIGFISFVPKNEYYLNSYIIKANNMFYNISQIENQSKIKVNLDSFSYHYSRKYKYYIFVNTTSKPLEIYKMIIGQKKPNTSRSEKIIIFEDNGLSKSLELYFDVEMEKANFKYGEEYISYLILPVNVENNLFDVSKKMDGHFRFDFLPEWNKKKKQNEKEKHEALEEFSHDL